MKLGHFNCEDLLYIYVFIPRFKYLKFIYQLFHLHLFLGHAVTNQFNDHLAVGLPTQLVRALHRYRRGQGFDFRQA